ncbi:phosphate signaling complex protein PhoU [Flexilinea flocculi]|uniref:Phosphate-specific transport system accessory protein PhoU n=1 Tax=Flexilinea flocculi TaxID=1678840 RepID=A0A0S7BT08_9CHLR|nr:phosphate signaling complex protein PhoU [Flexilinea flocculi]GAP41607.1 phosphate uptake regulator, PhoU [Flexilinea flocculi]
MRNKFDEQLELLNSELIMMGGLCEEVINMTTKALLSGNPKLAKEVFPLVEEIEKKEREIETLCLKLLLQQQPVAKDLRLISSALKMITDMARVGTQAADISEITLLENITKENSNIHIQDMALATIDMVNGSISAFVQRDLELAQAVIDYDDIVDEMFNEIKDDLIKLIGQDPSIGEYAVDMLMVSKYFEKIGDHAVNIAEWVVFSITGIHKEDHE